MLKKSILYLYLCTLALNISPAQAGHVVMEKYVDSDGNESTPPHLLKKVDSLPEHQTLNEAIDLDDLDKKNPTTIPGQKPPIQPDNATENAKQTTTPTQQPKEGIVDCAWRGFKAGLLGAPMCLVYSGIWNWIRGREHVKIPFTQALKGNLTSLPVSIVNGAVLQMILNNVINPLYEETADSDSVATKPTKEPIGFTDAIKNRVGYNRELAKKSSWLAWRNAGITLISATIGTTIGISAINYALGR